jgi:VWFA-related protein
MTSARLAVAIAIVSALGVVVAGQEPPAYRARIGLVVLHATVKNGRGEVVTGLGREAFSVYEDGKRQSITLFNHDDAPVSLGLVVDNSGSMRTLRPRVEASALSLVRASNADDEVFVINFADKARMDVPMTKDVHVLESGIARVDTIGGTALRDAVAQAETYLRQTASNPRKVIVVLSDGYDNASMTQKAELQKTAEQNAIAIYAIGLMADATTDRAHEGRSALTQLTKPTGGLALYPADADQIEPAAREVAREIRSQYTIAYAPLNQTLDGSYRAIRVDARGSERLTVTTRSGYRATGE